MQRISCFLGGLFILFALTAGAQFTKGTRMVGASVASGFFHSGTSDQTVTFIGSTTGKATGYGLSVAPSLGWFVSDKTAVGFLININPSSEKVTYEENGSTFQSDKSSEFNVGIGGFARNYFKSAGSFLPFGQFGFDVGMTNRKTEGFFYGGGPLDVYKRSYDGKSTGGFYSNMNLQLGVTKMLGDYTGLDFYVGYNYSYHKNTMNTTTLRDDQNNGSIDETSKNETITKYTNHRLLLGVGFQVFLAKKSK